MTNISIPCSVFYLEILKITLDRIKVNESVFPYLSTEVLEYRCVVLIILLQMDNKVITRKRRCKNLLQLALKMRIGLP
jgi:hypothetical protein